MKKSILLAIGGILTAVLVAVVGFAVMIALLFSNFGQKTVVQTLPSPEGGYEVRVIDDDQGALGGTTIVEVEKNGWFTRPERIYTGRWGEWKSMEIYWKSEHCLVINGKEYRVD